MRTRIDGHEAARAIAIPQLEVEALEWFVLRRTDVAEHITRAHVLLARAVQVGADRRDGLQMRVVRGPAIAVVDDHAEAVSEPAGEQDRAVVDRERRGHRGQDVRGGAVRRADRAARGRVVVRHPRVRELDAALAWTRGFEHDRSATIDRGEWPHA